MSNIDVSKLKVGDIVTLRGGAVVTVTASEHDNNDGTYRISLKGNNYDDSWYYNLNGTLQGMDEDEDDIIAIKGQGVDVDAIIDHVLQQVMIALALSKDSLKAIINK